jgi:4-hydroxybenzoate polyprenyltransferase
MHHLKIFIELTRLTKPIGFMLLFWPCSWGLASAYKLDQNLSLFLYYLLLFFLGSVLMRSAGCIVNDIVDKDYDKKVKRTKFRPLAAGRISVKRSLIYISILCFLAFLILIQFNFLTISLGLGSMIFAFSYPFMKRITYWPQLFLGLTFNWGLIMGWTSIIPHISIDILVLYVSAIFWTLAYDTIYGAQDMSDDEIIGIKSTSIKFKNNMKLFISISYFVSSACLIYFFRNDIGLNFLTICLICFYLSLVWQIIKFDKNDPFNCLKTFKLNNYSGFILLLTILFKNI